MAGEVATLVIKVAGGKEITVMTGQLKAMEKAAKKVTTQLDKTAGASSNLAGRQKRTASELSSSFKVIGRDLSRYVTLPFLAASAASLKFASDLTTGLGQVETLIAGTGSRIYELQELVTDLSKETGTSFDDLNRGLYETISAFQDGADTAGRFTAAVKAAVAGNASVLESVTLISAVTKAYGDTSQEAAEKVTNLAFAAVKYGQTTFKDLSNALQQVSANSNRLGVSQEELFSVFATLTGVTGDASNVATQYGRALISLSNPTEALSSLFAQYTTQQGKIVTTGKEFIEVMGGSVNAFKEIYDFAQRTGQPIEKFITRQTGVIAVTALANQQFDTFNKKASLVADSAGAMEEAFFAATTGIDEYQRILKQVRQTMATVGAEVGQILLPTIVTVAQQIADAAERFSALDESTQKTIIGILGITAALGPLLIVLGSVLRVVKLFGDLNLLAGAGALGFLNPVTIGLTVVVLAALAIGIGKVVKQIKLQAEALQDLKEASVGFQDANTQFSDLIQSTSDMTDVAERNNTIIMELSKTYGDDFAGGLDKSKASLNDIYQEMLKIEAFKFQSTLEAQSKQLESLQEQMGITAFKFKDSIDELNNLGLASEFDGDIEKMITALEDGLISVRTGPKILEYLELEEAFNGGRETISTFFDDLQADIEARTGGMLTLQRLFDEFGIEYTSDIVVIPKGTYDNAETLGRDLADAINTGLESGRRLKTWADFFAEITGIAGEAFARLEYDTEGNVVGFARGSGAKAADAYAKAFADELASTETIANAIGTAFTLEDRRDILEGQLDKAVGDITELLNTKIRESDFNKEGLQFDIADLLTGDEASVERMIQVFGLADTNIKGLIQTANAVRQAFNEANIQTIIADMNSELEEFRANTGMRLSFQQDVDYFESLNEQAETLQEEITRLRSESILDLNALTSAYQALFDLNKEMDTVADSFSVVNQEMENLPTLTEIASNAFYELARNIGFSQEAAWGLGQVFGGVAGAMIDSLSTLAFGLGEAYAGFGDWNDALGEMAKTLAETISQLAVTAGLQLIIQGNTGMGLALIAGGLTGQFVLGYVEGTIAEAEANATGGVYSGSQKLTKYAHGGVLGDYVNSIVDKPTYFANGSAIMGEAGAEAIMPLTRMSNGDLGVQTSGSNSGSSNVQININNYASDSTTATATQNADGSVDVNIVEKAVASAIANGGADKAMRSRFGVKVKGL